MKKEREEFILTLEDYKAFQKNCLYLKRRNIMSILSLYRKDRIKAKRRERIVDISTVMIFIGIIAIMAILAIRAQNTIMEQEVIDRVRNNYATCGNRIVYGEDDHPYDPYVYVGQKRIYLKERGCK